MASREPRPAPFRPPHGSAALEANATETVAGGELDYAASLASTSFVSKANDEVREKSMTRTTGRWLAAPLLAGPLLWTGVAGAATYSADPATYKSVLPTLLPGDTLNLAPGTYPLLTISGLRGTPDAWITVQGPPSGPPAVVIGYRGHNTVELVNASHLAVRNLRVDSRGIPGAFGLSAKDGAANLVHDILVEDCVFVGQGGSQQTDAISTKTPTWNWTIRGNVIAGAGVGLYLGASDGSAPFVAGLIEGNVIANPGLYGGEIKWQGPRPAVPGMPAGPSRTIIRHNVFIK